MAEYCNRYYFGTDNQESFEMVPDQPASFEDWLNRPGPYFQPAVDADGYLYWTNNGQLPNPEPVKIVGKDGRGITLTGQCATVAELPDDPDQGEAWAVGTEEPFECYAWFGEWVDMGLLFPAGQDGVSPAVTITTTATGHKVKITDRDHPSGQEFNVDNGEDGDPGADGVSPAVTITQTATGHKVKITDKDHPSGQEFDVDNGTPGAPGQGVPAGGSAGQFLRKASGTDYDAEWYSPAAGDVSYDSSLTYASGTVGEELNSQRNTLTQLEDGLITVNYGDTAESTILVNKYVYVNDHSTIPEGLYQNRSGNTIDVGTALTFNPGNLSTATGIINSLKNNVDNLISYIDYHGYTSYSFANWKTAISDNWSNIQKNFITRVKLSNSDITVIVSPMLENVNPAFNSSYGACLVFGRDIAVPCYGKLSNGVWSWSDENVAYVQLLGATSGIGSKTLSDSYANYRYIVLVAFGDSSGVYPAIIPRNMLLAAGYSLCVASKFNGTIGITAIQFSSSTTVNISSNPNSLRIYGIK